MSLKSKILTSKIVQKEWLQLHPLKLQSPTDFYYIQLSNKILNILLNDKLIIATPKDLMTLRQTIYTVYYKSCYAEEVLSKDIDKLKELVNYLNEMNGSKYDKIQTMQFNYLKNELVEILNKYGDKS